MDGNRAIGVFDSGLGGLSVVREILRQLPREEIVYFADSARCPYGVRPLEEVRQFVLEIIEFLDDSDVKIVVIACNTATAAGLEAARERFSTPIVGIIEHGAEAAVRASRSGRIGVIATEATIRSKAYEWAIKALRPEATVIGLSCQEFVELVETGRTEGKEVENTVNRCLSPLMKEDIDTLVLGCTHFPFLERTIKEVIDEKVAIVDPARKVVEHVKGVMKAESLERSISEPPEHEFFTTGDPETFRRIGENLLGRPISSVRHVDVPVVPLRS